MRIVETREDSAVLDLTEEELRLLTIVLLEITSGANALDDADWDMMIGFPRKDAAALRDGLFQVLQPMNDRQS